MLHRNLRGTINIRNQPKKTRNLVSWLSGKSLKLLPPCHILRLKYTKFDSWCLSVCVSDGVWHILYWTRTVSRSPRTAMQLREKIRNNKKRKQADGIRGNIENRRAYWHSGNTRQEKIICCWKGRGNVPENASCAAALNEIHWAVV